MDAAGLQSTSAEDNMKYKVAPVSAIPDRVTATLVRHRFIDFLSIPLSLFLRTLIVFASVLLG